MRTETRMERQSQDAAVLPGSLLNEHQLLVNRDHDSEEHH